MITLSILILLLCFWMDAQEKDRQDAERNAERRKNEIIVSQLKRELDRTSRRKTIRRRILKDKEGNVIAEEIIEEEGYDDTDDYDEEED